MNDFTKEELKDLYYAIRFFWKNRQCYDLPSDTEDGTTSHQLMDKIESMIDNYCEHEWTETYREREVSLCLKCDKEHYDG